MSVVVANVVEVQMAMAMVNAMVPGVKARVGEWAAPAVQALAEVATPEQL